MTLLLQYRQSDDASRSGSVAADDHLDQPSFPRQRHNPEVIGTVGAGSPTQVKIYKRVTCSGAADVTGTVAQFTGAGITVAVTEDAHTALGARASDVCNNDFTCSITTS